VARRAEVLQRRQSLAAREQQVTDLVVDGAVNQVIAVDLDLSERTVEVHPVKVMKKVRARSVAHLVKLQLLLSDQAQG
jgi:FixJ family two-component response regulator